MSDLSTRTVDYIRNLLIDHRPSGQAGAAAQELAREHGIGRVRGKTVYYEPKDFLAAANLLKVRGLEDRHPVRGGLRSDSAPGGSEKTGAALVSAHMVAAVPLHMPIRVPPGASFIACDWRELDPASFEVVLVVENLEPFMQLQDFGWLHELFVQDRPTLAIYRGMPGEMFRTDPPAQFLRAVPKPVLGFYDFDPEGLAMAASQPLLEALCLPHEDQLESAVRRYRRDHLYINQVSHCRSRLDALQAGPVHASWQLLKRLQCGLPQENFPR